MGNQDQGIDFVHIDDLVDAVILCLFNKHAYNKEYLINGPEQFSFGDYIKKIARFSELPPPKFKVALPLVLVIAILMELSAKFINFFRPRFHPFITRFQVYILTKPMRLNITKAENDLGYYPKINFNKGIDELKEYISQCDLPGLDIKR